MNKKISHILLVLWLIASLNDVVAQVTIGSGVAPTFGALLDLKSQQAKLTTDPNSDDNITSTKGGLLLPRVKLVSTSSLNPFLTVAEATDEVKASLAGLMIYNLYNNGTDLYPNFYIWDGSEWVTAGLNKAAQSMTIAQQPKGFSFYETGIEAEKPVETLEFIVNPAKDTNGTPLAVTYQWYEIVGGNLHARVGKKLESTSDKNNGSQSATYTPKQVLKGTTRNANNAGFYRFYCEASAQGNQATVGDSRSSCGMWSKR